MPSELNNYYRPEPAIGKSEKGSANGVATLDGSGLVPSNQLPSYVDDVLEFASLSNFPETGEIGKIYVAIDTNKSYRWSGSTYVELSAYALATQAAAGLMSAADKTKLDGVTAGAEPNPGDATQQASGLMSATDKAKLDGIATGATAVIVSDSLSDTSTTKALSAAKGKALNDQIAIQTLSVTIPITATFKTVHAYKIGRLVYVGGYFGQASSIAAATEILTGLPAPANTDGRYPASLDNNVCGLVYYDSGKWRLGGVASTSCNFGFVYVSAS